MKQLNYRSIFSAVTAGASKTLRHRATATALQLDTSRLWLAAIIPPPATCPSFSCHVNPPFCHTRFIDSVSILGLFFKRTCCEIVCWLESKTGFTQWLINLGHLPMGCQVNRSLSQ